MKKNRIFCFGEVLWDVFPTHKVVGGAPLNVCFHAKNLGLNTQIISAIGRDKLGEELNDFLIQNKISADFIHTNNTLLTSTVDITLAANGNASYNIKEHVAWDALFIDESIKRFKNSYKNNFRKIIIKIEEIKALMKNNLYLFY